MPSRYGTSLKCLSYDLKPIRPNIEKRDIRDGLQEEVPEEKLDAILNQEWVQASESFIKKNFFSLRNN
jgi:hypothetical protein